MVPQGHLCSPSPGGAIKIPKPLAQSSHILLSLTQISSFYVKWFLRYSGTLPDVRTNVRRTVKHDLRAFAKRGDNYIHVYS